MNNQRIKPRLKWVDTAKGICILLVIFNHTVRISLKWYRCSGRMVPCGAEAWYRSYRSDGTGTKSPICTLSKGAVRKIPQGTLR